MARVTFFKQKYDESTVLARARKHARKDLQLAQTIEVLYLTPGISDEDLRQSLPGNVDLPIVQNRLRPMAAQIIAQERARNNVVTGTLASGTAKEEKNDKALTTNPKDVQIIDPQQGLSLDSLEAIESQAIHIVLRSQSGVTLSAQIKRWILFLFKTFAPLAVLCLTIPESIYVFTHIYRVLDSLLAILSGVFAVLVDFGYLYLTVLVELNKEALFKRLRAGLEVEDYERKALRTQSILWWVVAAMDMSAQVVFLYGATQGSTFFAYPVVMTLVAVRIASLFITMFVVSFAGTELMTDIDVIANEQVERIDKINKIMVAGATAAQKKTETRIRLEQIEADQSLRREGDAFLKEMYSDAREDAKRLREEMRRLRSPKGPDGYLN